MPMAHDVNILGRVGVVFMNAHSQEVDVALIHILEEQVECHGVVDVVTHVGLKYDGLRRRFALCGGIAGAEGACYKEKE